MSETVAQEESTGEPSELVFFGLPRVYVAIGSHIAHFFRGEPERMTVLGSFIKAGLEAGDLCVLITEVSESLSVKDHLADLGVDVETALTSGQLLTSRGSSEIEKMASIFEHFVFQAQSAGRNVIRIGGDMTWVLSKLAPPEKLLEWEAFYDRFVSPRSSFIALCQYDYIRFAGSAIMYALETHPLSIIGNIVQENPFYRDPDEVLRELAQSVNSPSPKQK
jgi:hypothetical protein